MPDPVTHLSRVTSRTCHAHVTGAEVEKRKKKNKVKISLSDFDPSTTPGVAS